ncbi:GGDEF domain-containing protein [Paenibacillus sp. N4]|uniref:GGDEF domain-containing protein n=1 Tax=Paenibacillus vietnamensis TaxID=2590547 RepID=UPI001CD13E3C|nr:GGDEF domain-containing protein [Paenibacillus vietnamensis]MCA0753688.1 GGDEF domain-containing protein [Paenibacillus vietnamensis]
MTFTQWLAGPDSRLLFLASQTVILLLMLLMSLRLYASYRSKQLYSWLILALLLMIAAQLPAAASAVTGAAASARLYLGRYLLQIVSFIIINFVFMKLHTGRSIHLKAAPFVAMGLLAFAAAGIGYAAGPSAASAGFGFPAADLYGVIVILMIMLGSRAAAMGTSYYAGLLVYFAGELARLADAYAFAQSVGWLTLLGRLLPVVYCALLFVQLFEWVLDRLQLTYQSSIADGLTGLYNRRHFELRAARLLRQSKSAAVIFCDLDNFKLLNDTYGHHKADSVLRQAAGILKEETGGNGAAGRYGGEELVACIGTEKVKPAAAAESIRRRIESETMVTVSIGFSTTKESKELHELIKQADEAMYVSKKSGKNKVTAYKAAAKAKSGK